MARIRSIKPEFGTDGKIRRLSDSSALFFILLWTHCDDFGFFTLDTLELSMKVGRWRSQDMMKMLRALHGQGLIKASAGDGVGMVVGWNHQKIKDRRVSKWNDSIISWDESFSNAVESEKNRPRSDLIGSDLIGSDLLKRQAKPPAVSVVKVPKKLSPNPANLQTWISFHSAYVDRYRVEPIRNAKVNSAISQFVQRVGESDAPSIIAFFVGHNDSFYVKNMHSVSFALRDAESLRTQWLKGRAITQADIKRFEQSADHRSLLDLIDREGI